MKFQQNFKTNLKFQDWHNARAEGPWEIMVSPRPQSPLFYIVALWGLNPPYQIPPNATKQTFLRFEEKKLKIVAHFSITKSHVEPIFLIKI